MSHALPALQEPLIQSRKICCVAVTQRFKRMRFRGKAQSGQPGFGSLLFLFRRVRRLIITGTDGLTCIEKMLMRGIGF
jgi:hypothetical protein